MCVLVMCVCAGVCKSESQRSVCVFVCVHACVRACVCSTITVKSECKVHRFSLIYFRDMKPPQCMLILCTMNQLVFPANVHTIVCIGYAKARKSVNNNSSKKQRSPACQALVGCQQLSAESLWHSTSP